MSTLGSFVWSIADQLRGVYRPNQYGGVVLPFTILRRLDCLMEPTRDEVRALADKDEGAGLAARVKRTTGMPFYNTSPFTFAELLKDPEGLAANLIDYTTGFSDNIDVFERFKFAAEVTTLAEKNRLYLVVSKFAEVDLHPDTVPNAEMGDLFEELIRRFAEASNETAGEHYTPRDAIRLMVDLLFAEDSAALLEPGTVRSIYDPTAGVDKGTTDLTLGTPVGLVGATGAGSATSKDPKMIAFAAVLDRLNDLFGHEDFSQAQKVSFLESLLATLLADEGLVQQAAVNTRKQFAESPDFDDALTGAVSDNQGAHNKMADYFFTNATGRAQLVATIADAFYQYAVSTPG